MEKVSVIDITGIPQNAIPAYSETSLFIRNTVRQQPGFENYEIFHQTRENGDLQVITIATWANQQHLNNARLVVPEMIQKAGINLPAFLEQHGITVERSIYKIIEE